MPPANKSLGPHPPIFRAHLRTHGFLKALPFTVTIDLSDESAFAVRWAVLGDSVILQHSVLYGADWGSRSTIPPRKSPGRSWRDGDSTLSGMGISETRV
ncbi:hypothetical protein ACLOJK_028459 [Asimina triloba]